MSEATEVANDRDNLLGVTTESFINLANPNILKSSSGPQSDDILLSQFDWPGFLLDGTFDRQGSFAATLLGTVWLEAGVWTFYCETDDGYRLWINGELVSEDDYGHARDPIYFQINVEESGVYQIDGLFFNSGGAYQWALGACPPGHEIRVVTRTGEEALIPRFSLIGGDSVLPTQDVDIVGLSSPLVIQTIRPVADLGTMTVALANEVATNSALQAGSTWGTASVFNLADPDAATQSSTGLFNSSEGPVTPLPGTNNGADDNVVAVVTGSLEVPKAGEYTFFVRADDVFDWQVEGAGATEIVRSNTPATSLRDGHASADGVTRNSATVVSMEFADSGSYAYRLVYADVVGGSNISVNQIVPGIAPLPLGTLPAQFTVAPETYSVQVGGQTFSTDFGNPPAIRFTADADQTGPDEVLNLSTASFAQLLATFRENFGRTDAVNGFVSGDWDGDGDVDLADLNILRAEFRGDRAPPSAAQVLQVTQGSLILELLEGGGTLRYGIQGIVAEVGLLPGGIVHLEPVLGADGATKSVEVGVTGASGTVDVNGVPVAPGATVLTTVVAIDIKPGSERNPVIGGSQGALPVAILGSADFDATRVDPMSVTLEGAAVRLKPNGKAQAGLKDVDGDGRTDMLVHIDTKQLRIPDGSRTAILSGVTIDGTVFFRGEDTVSSVPQKGPR